MRYIADSIVVILRHTRTERERERERERGGGGGEGGCLFSRIINKCKSFFFLGGGGGERGGEREREREIYTPHIREHTHMQAHAFTHTDTYTHQMYMNCTKILTYRDENKDFFWCKQSHHKYLFHHHSDLILSATTCNLICMKNSSFQRRHPHSHSVLFTHSITLIHPHRQKNLAFKFCVLCETACTGHPSYHFVNTASSLLCGKAYADNDTSFLIWFSYMDQLVKVMQAR